MAAAPAAKLWGVPRILESRYFRFHYRQQDAAAVAIAASRLDAIYPAMRRNFGLPPAQERLEIEVDVTVAGPFISRFHVQQLQLPSPGLFRLDADISDADALTQWALDPLAALVLAKAQQRVSPDPAAAYTWQPMRSALEAWQVRQYSPPSAAWHRALIAWLYDAEVDSSPAQKPADPSRLNGICHEQHIVERMSFLARIQLTNIYLCAYVLKQAYIAYPGSIPLLLSQVPTGSDLSTNQVWGWEQSEVLATVVDYSMAVYGPERLPALLQAFHDTSTWRDLIPQVFGVSSAEFEAGWQEYLAHGDLATRQ